MHVKFIGGPHNGQIKDVDPGVALVELPGDGKGEDAFRQLRYRKREWVKITSKNPPETLTTIFFVLDGLSDTEAARLIG